MSTKRTSTESSSTDEQTNDDGQANREDDDAKRAKLVSLSDTTMQDLPIELIELILIKVVAMEVKGMKLAKSVWKEKADLVLTRLRSVCSQWSSICTSDYLRNKVHETLDRSPHTTIRLEILQQYQLPCSVKQVITLNTEIWILQSTGCIKVYDRDNMAELKDVVQVPELWPQSMTPCNVSNCVYVLKIAQNDHVIVFCVKRDEHEKLSIKTQFNIYFPNSEATILVTAEGHIMLTQRIHSRPVLTIFDTDGSVLRKLNEFTFIPLSQEVQVFPHSNGNLVVTWSNNYSPASVAEIDLDVNIIRNNQSASPECLKRKACRADSYGRFILYDHNYKMELLDSEFNMLSFDGPVLKGAQYTYDTERNEVMAILFDGLTEYGTLAVFQFTEALW